MLTANVLSSYGYSEAIHGMRNPKNSWKNSDSSYVIVDDNSIPAKVRFEIGPNDLKLMHNLCKAGTEHRKYLRMIVVYIDINAPLYWWKEFDTYKIGTVANSCSTMHKIDSKEFDIDDFSVDKMTSASRMHLFNTIILLNAYRERYLMSKDKSDWNQLIYLLPTNYMQKRTVMLNYEVILRILEQRSNHKLAEWHSLCHTLRALPYIKELINNE